MSKELKEQFISELTRDLNPEQEILLTKELENIVETEHPNLENAVTSLQTKKYHKHSIGRWALIACLLVAYVLIPPLHSFNLNKNSLDDYSPHLKSFNYTVEERLLLESSDDSSSAKRLWQSEPKNLGYLANYLISVNGGSGGLMSYNESLDTFEPNEIYRKAGQLDPDNSLYAFLMAASFEDTVKRSKNYLDLESDINDLEEKITPLTPAEKLKLESLKLQILSEKEYDILDEEKFNQATVFLETALAKPMFNRNTSSYQSECTSLLIEKFGVNDISSSLPCIAHANSRSSFLILVSVHNIYCAQLERVCNTGDHDNVKRLISRYIDCLSQINDNSNNLIDSLISQALIRNGIQSMVRISKRIDWKEILPKLEECEKLLHQYDQQLDLNQKMLGYDNKINFLDSLVGTGTLGTYSANPVIITDQALDKSRYTMHACMGRTIFRSFFHVMGLILFACWIFRFTRKSKITLVITKVNNILTIKDWFIFLALSVVLPLTLFWFTIHSRGLGAREWSIDNKI